MGGFLDYSPGNSFLHRLNPIVKIFLSLMICVSCFITDSPFFCIAIIFLNIVMAASAGILPRALAMLRTLIKFCTFLFLIQVFFIRDGTVLFSLPFDIYVTDKGVMFSLMMAFRLVGATLPLALMLSITKMNDLSNVLVGTLGMPYKYAFSLTTAIRFIPVFTAEMAGIMEAQTARGVAFDTKNIFRKIGLIFPLCVPLLITSVRKIEGAAISAELRGFNCRKRDSGYKSYPFRAADIGIILFAFALAAAGAFSPF
ncbi:MAG: energy-coupling factor transporter transmembrane component T [Synergistaceae bacterium]|nr:energy-coupling factor transporter transmembrane component T [Synergistaceae bacterium]